MVDGEDHPNVVTPELLAETEALLGMDESMKEVFETRWTYDGKAVTRKFVGGREVREVLYVHPRNRSVVMDDRVRRDGVGRSIADRLSVALSALRCASLEVRDGVAPGTFFVQFVYVGHGLRDVWVGRSDDFYADEGVGHGVLMAALDQARSRLCSAAMRVGAESQGDEHFRVRQKPAV